MRTKIDTGPSRGLGERLGLIGGHKTSNSAHKIQIVPGLLGMIEFRIKPISLSSGNKHSYLISFKSEVSIENGERIKTNSTKSFKTNENIS